MINSFQMNITPVPFIMICFKIEINHLAGMIVDSHCSIKGIFSIGKINPERIIVGNINAIMEMNIAIC